MRKQTFILKWAWKHTCACCCLQLMLQLGNWEKSFLGRWPRGQGLSFLTATANKRVQRLQGLAEDAEVREPLLPWPHSLSGHGVKHFHMETGKTSPQLGLEDSPEKPGWTHARLSLPGLIARHGEEIQKNENEINISSWNIPKFKRQRRYGNSHF